jgi:hypothetical protein
VAEASPPSDRRASESPTALVVVGDAGVVVRARPELAVGSSEEQAAATRAIAIRMVRRVFIGNLGRYRSGRFSWS